MQSLKQIDKELAKTKEHGQNLKKKRDERLKADKQKLKDKVGTHITNDNNDINLNNYTEFTTITKKELKENNSLIKHFQSIADDMKYVNGSNGGYWYINDIKSVSQWLADNVRNKKAKKSSKKNSTNENVSNNNPNNNNRNDYNQDNHGQDDINLFDQNKS